MTSDDHDAFKAALQHLATVQRITLTPAIVKAYWSDIKEMSRAEFETAFSYLKKKAKWFPKPAEFHAAKRAGWM